MNANVDEFLAARAHARAVGDLSLEQAMNAELARLGHREAPAAPVVAVAQETTVAPAPPERAVPAARRRRQSTK